MRIAAKENANGRPCFAYSFNNSFDYCTNLLAVGTLAGTKYAGYQLA
jgi:hypothetical protein